MAHKVIALRPVGRSVGGWQAQANNTCTAHPRGDNLGDCRCQPPGWYMLLDDEEHLEIPGKGLDRLGIQRGKEGHVDESRVQAQSRYVVNGLYALVQEHAGG